jgi:NADH dehydrogenase
VAARTILWAAGNKANSLGKLLQERTGAELDRAGRVVVKDNLEVPTAPHVFVIGDLAHFKQPDGKPLPAVAPVAMQQGKYFAKLVKARLAGRTPKAFEYFNKGNLAVIGRNQAIAELGKVHIYGFFAWIAWVFVHIAYLIQFESRIVVLFRWAVNYVTRRRGARLITGEGLSEPKSAEPTGHHPTPESSANTSGVAGSTPTAAPLSQTAAGGQTL